MPLPSVSPGPLAGCRVLIIEDEYFLAEDIVRELKALGARIIGPVGELEEAANIVEEEAAIDAAIVDINLQNDMVFPLARKLRVRKIPFVFTTGYDKSSIEAEFHDIRLWEKPVDITAMARELTGLIDPH
jgi:two-component SAPR family response regulator